MGRKGMYRCTRRLPYPQGSAGFSDPAARQGHYIEADTIEEAAEVMTTNFPAEAGLFDFQLWRQPEPQLNRLGVC